MKRKDPTLSEKLAALVIQHFDIDYEHAKKMSTAEILSLVQTDHEVHAAVAIANGETPKQYNHPSRLTIRLYKDHRHKTAKYDIPAIAKSDRISPEHEAFQRRILAKSGQDSGVATTEAKPRAKMKSRGFQKAPEGHQWFKRKG